MGYNIIIIIIQLAHLWKRRIQRKSALCHLKCLVLLRILLGKDHAHESLLLEVLLLG